MEALQQTIYKTHLVLASRAYKKLFEDHVTSQNMWMLELYSLFMEDMFEQDLYISEHGGGMEPYFLYINPNKNCPELEQDFNRM